MEDGYRKLANAIIFQAIYDYQHGKPGRKAEVSKFLNSPWCDMLLPGKSITGNTIKSRISTIKLPQRSEW